MFLGILSWMIAHTPSFMRPAIGWLVDGLRKITGHIAAMWNAVGTSAGQLFGAIAVFKAYLATFAVRVANGFWWVKNVYLPARLNALLYQIVGFTNAAIAYVESKVMGFAQAVLSWAQWAIAEVEQFIDAVRRWAEHELSRVSIFVNALVTALGHVLGGPARLAEWLVGEMWRALLRRVFAERERIATWILTQSVSFAAWLARQLEDLIVRIL